MFLSLKKNYAVIFDMDGVIVDNMEYHKAAWKKFIHKYAPNTDLEKFSRHFGKTNADLIKILFSQPLKQDRIHRLAEEKEAIYRNLYKPFIAPTPGLVPFLEKLKNEKKEMIVATSAPTTNVDFVLDQTALRPYFKTIVDSSQVKKGKPDPEIYCLAAAQTKQPPSRCLVFEDSYPGIASAKSAGMKVIGVATTYSAEKLKGADKVIGDFTEISPADVQAVLF
jgi:beta-phosphoglucomutase family hydrolase